MAGWDRRVVPAAGSRMVGVDRGGREDIGERGLGDIPVDMVRCEDNSCWFMW